MLPGGAGSLLGAAASTLQRMIGRGADLALESLLRATSLAAIPVKSRTAEAVAASIALIADELTNAEAGNSVIVSYEITLCVMRVWRETSDMRGLAFCGNTELLQRFRRLVEERYREHLPLTAYAAALGVSLDRLHAVCTRVLGRSPRKLLQERLLTEAIARLEHSGTSVKQVAFALGFKDTSHFNRFFQQHVGQPPGTWRRRCAIQGRQSQASRIEPTFADWP
jgi:AraC family transcriptional activator of pobA